MDPNRLEESVGLHTEETEKSIKERKVTATAKSLAKAKAGSTGPVIPIDKKAPWAEKKERARMNSGAAPGLPPTGEGIPREVPAANPPTTTEEPVPVPENTTTGSTNVAAGRASSVASKFISLS